MLIHLEKLGKSFGEKIVLHDVTASVEREDRIGIVGQNGAGKTTLLKILTGEYTDYEGEFSVTHGVTLGYLEQNAKLDPTLDIYGEMRSCFAHVLDAMAQMQILERRMAASPEDASLLEQHDALQNIIDAADGYNMDVNIKKVLSGMGFAQDTWTKNIAVLSGGELTRLRFAEIVLERPNLLFLDEPTNHLDIYTRENLTEALMAYTGTLLMVTHDRHLMNSLGCPILYLEDGKATLYPSYDALMGRAAPAAAPEKAGDQPAKAGYGKEQRRRRAELRAKIKACEDEMEACGAREVELDNEINSPEVYNDPDLLRQKSDELSDLRFHQEELFAAWEKAMEEQEQYEQAAGEE